LSNTTKTNKKHWSRAETAEKVNKYEQEYQRTPSQRQLAKDLGVPRTTLQHWLKRKGSIDADPAVVAFFESPTGVAFLHRLVVAAHFVMTLVGPCGIRLVCLFLELTSLDQFVAASYGPHQKVSVAMQDAVIAFGQEERERLAENMSHKQITVCEDETFHPQVCLVAIEPVSNFILLERYADNRKAKTWTKMMKEVTADLSVEIIQSTSDEGRGEGRGLIHHVRDDLGVQHSPDVFHVQHELVKGTSLVLAHKTRQAGNAVAELAQKLNRHQEKKKKYLDDKNGSKRLAKLEQPANLSKPLQSIRSVRRKLFKGSVQLTILTILRLVRQEVLSKSLPHWNCTSQSLRRSPWLRICHKAVWIESKRPNVWL
jgi:hypothetical protein